jgi:hypothetical protein
MRSTMTLARMNGKRPQTKLRSPWRLEQTQAIELAVVSVDEPQSPT